MNTETAVQAEIYGVAAVLQMMDGQANALFAALGTLGMVGVTGRLGLVRVSNYPTFYGVELRDSTGSGDPLFLDIPRGLQPKDLEGKEVEAFGFLHSKKGLKSTALQVSRLKLASDLNPVQIEEDKALRAIFGKANAGPDAFPLGGELLISFLHGITSAVKADFLGQMQDLPPKYMEAVEVNLRDPGSIAEGVRRARGNVVCLLRGGGADGDFEVFNHLHLLEAWRDKAAFKITALGHTQNTTLLDRFSHKVSKTPTEAGTWIMGQLIAQQEREHWREAALEAGKATQKASEDAAQKLQGLQGQLLKAAEANVRSGEQFRAASQRVEDLQAHAVIIQKATEEAARNEEHYRASLKKTADEAIQRQDALQVQVNASLAREAARGREVQALRGRSLPRWVWMAMGGAVLAGVLLGWIIAR